MTQTSMTAGIDTSKANLDIAVHDRADLWQVDNTPTGWRLLVAEFCKAGVTRVGIEASGGYERGVVEHLPTKGFTVLVPQPIQVKAYARVHLRRAKNDKLDAFSSLPVRRRSNSRGSGQTSAWRSWRDF